MKQVLLWIIILLHCSPAICQKYLHLSDTSGFRIFYLNDTIDNYTVQYTPKADTMLVDIDCDGIDDIILRCYKNPLPNLPPTQEIEIVNLAGSAFEMLSTSSNWVQALRLRDSVLLDPNPAFSSKTNYQLLYFNVRSGASWAGIKGTDSSRVTNMYLVFRKNIAGSYHYGWLNYSGTAYPAKLVVHSVAIDKTICPTSTSTLELKTYYSSLQAFPNPVENDLFLEMTGWSGAPLRWRLTDAVGMLSQTGIIQGEKTRIPMPAVSCSSGLFVLQVVDNNGIILENRKIVRVK